jgi:hypothetical protein
MPEYYTTIGGAKRKKKEKRNIQHHDVWTPVPLNRCTCPVCNRPWVMRQHCAHVSSSTGLIYYCTRLGLSSTASLIVSRPFHPHHFPLMNCHPTYRSSLRAASLLPRYDTSYYGCMYSHLMYYLRRLPCVPKTAS